MVFRETHKVNGQLLRDRILSDKNNLPAGGRLSSTYYSQLLMEWAGDQQSFANLKPDIQGESISDSLVQALECCSKTNPAARTTEPLEAILRHASAMNQTEIFGMVKALISNQQLGQPCKDSLILETMNYLIRVELTEKWPALMQVLVFCLCRFIGCPVGVMYAVKNVSRGRYVFYASCGFDALVLQILFQTF